VKIGLLLPFAGRGVDFAAFFGELRAEAVEAEAQGFDGVFIGEHHQQEGFTSPLHVLAALGACTERVRLGAGVLLLPVHHPIRLAEDTAHVDVISGGRLIVGVGTGYQRDDFTPFGVPFEERVGRFEEGLAILRAAWASDRVAHAGRYWAFPEVRVMPKPLQRPGPPIWGAAWTEAGLRRVASGCDGWIVDPVQRLPVVRGAVDRARALVHGRRFAIAVIRSAWVASTARQAREEWAQSALAAHAYFFRRGVYRVAHDPWVAEVPSPRDLTFDRIAPERLLCGDPSEVAHELARWRREVAPDWLILSLRNGTHPSHARTVAAIRRFGHDVIPRLGG
jgi:alkanesulfonate monooxygenase SsuD/methylene tetrahydromethanopterin reductase-like flavin-dependent oxidoreductase (luciferase family)